VTIAFFDYDGTLVRRDSATICAIPAVRRGMVPAGLGARVLASFLLTKVGFVAKEHTHRLSFLVYRGRTREEIEAIVAELYRDHVRAHVSPAMRRAVEEHRRRGDRLVVATAAGEFFPRPLAAELGFEDVLGTRLRFDGDVCTGEVDGQVLDGEVKRERAWRYAEERGVSLEACTFYSDSISDAPLLEAVGAAVCVGPTRDLRARAKARGWPVVAHDHDGPVLHGPAGAAG
jgi:HAD superfamily hydrolase (TIGR01490 family)